MRNIELCNQTLKGVTTGQDSVGCWVLLLIEVSKATIFGFGRFRLMLRTRCQVWTKLSNHKKLCSYSFVQLQIRREWAMRNLALSSLQPAKPAQTEKTSIRSASIRQLVSKNNIFKVMIFYLLSVVASTPDWWRPSV